MYKLNVIVVDDDIVQRMRLKKQLNGISPPLNSITMSNGHQLMKFFNTLPEKQQNDHFIVFLESGLPNDETRTSLEQLDQQIKAMENMKVIMTGSNACAKMLEFSESYDMVIGYLTKPIKKKDILKSIKAIEPRYA